MQQSIYQKTQLKILAAGILLWLSACALTAQAQSGISDPAARGYTDTTNTTPSPTAPTSNTSPGSAAIQSQNYTEYRLLAPLPFIGNTLSLQNGARQDSFANYVNSLYRLLVLVGSVLAVVFFAIGGFLYMTGEALDTKEAGRSRMRGAVLGLLLLLAPYIILNAINPDLLKLSLVIPGVSYRTSPVTSSIVSRSGTLEQPPEKPPDNSASGTISRTFDGSCPGYVNEGGAIYVLDKLTGSSGGKQTCSFLQVTPVSGD